MKKVKLTAEELAAVVREAEAKKNRDLAAEQLNKRWKKLYTEAKKKGVYFNTAACRMRPEDCRFY